MHRPFAETSRVSVPEAAAKLEDEGLGAAVGSGHRRRSQTTGPRGDGGDVEDLEAFAMDLPRN